MEYEGKTALVSLHHEVLIPWAELRSRLAAPPPVLSLDFHTDTLACTARGIPAPGPMDGLAPESVRNAVRILHHDEHFDWALRAGLISKAVILSISPQIGPTPCPGLRVLPFRAVPPVQTILNDPESARAFAGTILSRGLPESAELDFTRSSGPWILDIDCDVFLTENAPDYPEDGLFADWVRRASLITVSRESDWVKLLRFPGERMTGELLASRLLEKIRATLQRR